MVQEIPGFYYDEERQRYFRITDQNRATASSMKYTQEYKKKVQHVATEPKPVKNVPLSNLILFNKMGNSAPNFASMHLAMVSKRWSYQFESNITGISSQRGYFGPSNVKIFTTSKAYYSKYKDESWSTVEPIEMSSNLSDIDFYNTWDLIYPYSLGDITVGISDHEPVMKIMYMNQCTMVVPKLGVSSVSLAPRLNPSCEDHLLIGTGKMVQKYEVGEDFIFAYDSVMFNSDVTALECGISSLYLVGQRNGLVTGYAPNDPFLRVPLFKIKHPSSVTKVIPVGCHNESLKTSPFLLVAGLKDSMNLYDLRMLRDVDAKNSKSGNCKNDSTMPVVSYEGYRQGPHFRHGLCTTNSLVCVSDTDNRVKIYDIMSGRRLNGGKLTRHKFEHQITGLSWAYTSSSQGSLSTGLYVASGSELSFWSSGIEDKMWEANRAYDLY